jgi:hypothetical protein
MPGIRIARFDRLPIGVLLGKAREPKQRERRLAGVGVGAKDDEISHTDYYRGTA